MSVDENHPAVINKFFLVISGVKDMFLSITFNTSCTITEDKIPSPILYIFLPPLGKNNRDKSELSLYEKKILVY